MRAHTCAQENASKPEGLPPSQGGKYVGFGSSPAPLPPSRGGAGGAGVEDVTQMLSKGLSSLGMVGRQPTVGPALRCAHAG
jgi:ADP-ribosylation factor GTPase-activating protein 1